MGAVRFLLYLFWGRLLVARLHYQCCVEEVSHQEVRPQKQGP